MATIAPTMTTTIPALRRCDELVAIGDAAARTVADALRGLTRAELGVMCMAIGSGTTYFDVYGACYVDGYDPETARWFGHTRRLSEKAVDKALRSLWEKGLIRVEGTMPRRDYEDPWLEDYGVQRTGNSNIGLYDGEAIACSGTRRMTAQQVAGHTAAYLSGLTDRDPRLYLSYRATERVRITVAPDLDRAYNLTETVETILRDKRRVQDHIDWVSRMDVVERVLPDTPDILNAVSGARFDAERAGKDVGGVWRAMNDALHEFRDAALYGSAPDDSMTPERHAREVAKTTDNVVAINARIEAVLLDVAA